MRTKHDRFAKGSGCYQCGCCGKLTRETNPDAASCRLCAACYEEALWENAHSDRDHEHSPDPECPICKEISKGKES